MVVSAPSVVKGGIYTIASGNLSKSVTLDSLIYGESGGMGAAAPNGSAPGGNAPGNGAAPGANGEQPSGNKPSDNCTQPPEKPDFSKKIKQETLIQTADLIKSPTRSLMKTEILHSLQKSKNLHKTQKAHRAEKIPRRL